MSPPTFVPGVRVAGDTNVGKVRTTNEDSMIAGPATVASGATGAAGLASR